MSPLAVPRILAVLYLPWKSHVATLLLLAAGGLVHVTGQLGITQAGPPTFAIGGGELAPELGVALGAVGFRPLPPGSARPDLLLSLTRQEDGTARVDVPRVAPEMTAASLRAARAAVAEASAAMRARLGREAGLGRSVLEPLDLPDTSPLGRPRPLAGVSLPERFGSGGLILLGLMLQMNAMVVGHGFVRARQAGRLEAFVPTGVTPRGLVATLILLATACGVGMSAIGLAGAALTVPGALAADWGRLAAVLALPPVLAADCSAAAIALAQKFRSTTAVNFSVALTPVVAGLPLLAARPGPSSWPLDALPFSAAVQAMAGVSPDPGAALISWGLTAALVAAAAAAALVPARSVDWGRIDA